MFRKAIVPTEFTFLACITILGTILFYFIPLIILLWYFILEGKSNLITVIENPAFLLALKNTLILMISIPASILLALLISLLRMESFAARIVLLMPAVIPSVAVASIWKTFFSIEGLLNQFLSWIGCIPTNWLSSRKTTFLFMFLFIWKYVGIDSVLLLHARNHVNKDILDAARIDGASQLQIFFYIEFPHIISYLVFLFLSNLLFFWRMFREIYLITGDYPFDGAYYVQHYLLHAFRDLNISVFSAASIIVVGFVIVIVLTLLSVSSQIGEERILE